MSEIFSSFLTMLKACVIYTIPLSIISFTFGVFIAVLVALIRLKSRPNFAVKLLQFFCKFYLSITRGTPLLVQLFIIFYGLPSIGVTISPFFSAIIAFSLNIGAYLSESIRAAILAVPKGQMEAALSVAMTPFVAFWRIIAPQALRIAVPTLSNSFIALIKDTSLASVVLVAEMFRVAQNIASLNYEFLRVYSQAALIYWVVCLFLEFWQSRLEARFSRHL